MLCVLCRIDGYETDPTGGDWFCYHSSSPFIFPPGFCDRNNIKLKVGHTAFIGWLVGWVVGWLVSWLVGFLVGFLVGYLMVN